MNHNVHEKIMQTCREMQVDLTVNLPYYGHFLLLMSFTERPDIQTCAVNVTTNGMQYYYNSDFLNRISQKMVNFVVIHNIFHLLWNHPKRTVEGAYDAKLASVVQDMIINHVICEDIDNDYIELPVDKNGNSLVVFVPKEYTGPLIFEFLYDWMHEKQEEQKEKQKNEQGQKCQKDEDKQKGEKSEEGDGEGENEGNGEKEGKPQLDSTGKPSYGQYGKKPSKSEKDKDATVGSYSLEHILDTLDQNNGEYLDTHMADEVQEEVRDEIMKEVLDRLRARGFEESNITTSINKLRKQNKDYLSYIKRTLSNEMFGSKRSKTITRPNRRDIEGIKGFRKIKNKIIAILDTSGSMGGTFEKILAYIYRNDIEVILIEADTQVKWVQRIKRKNQLSSTKIVGGGGTVLQPAINYAVDHYNGTNFLILTDGICDRLDISNVKGNVLMISIDREVPISKSNGKIKQIIVSRTK